MKYSIFFNNNWDNEFAPFSSEKAYRKADLIKHGYNKVEYMPLVNLDNSTTPLGEYNNFVHLFHDFCMVNMYNGFDLESFFVHYMINFNNIIFTCETNGRYSVVPDFDIDNCMEILLSELKKEPAPVNETEEYMFDYFRSVISKAIGTNKVAILSVASRGHQTITIRCEQIEGILHFQTDSKFRTHLLKYAESGSIILRVETNQIVAGEAVNEIFGFSMNDFSIKNMVFTDVKDIFMVGNTKELGSVVFSDFSGDKLCLEDVLVGEMAY